MQGRNKLCRLSFAMNTERLLEVRSSGPYVMLVDYKRFFAQKSLIVRFSVTKSFT